MDDLAAEANMRKPSLYHHVSGKEDLLLALHERWIDENTEVVVGIVARSMTAEEKLRNFIVASVGFIAEHSDLSVIWIQDRTVFESDRWRPIVAKRDVYERILVGLIEDGVNSGTFRDTDPAVVARGVLGMITWCATWLRPHGALAPQQIAQLFSDMVLGGLLVESATDEAAGSSRSTR